MKSAPGTFRLRDDRTAVLRYPPPPGTLAERM